MIEELHLHHLPNILKESKQSFINEIVSICNKYDVKTAIRGLKISGICFSPYTGKDRRILLNDCYQQLLEIDSQNQCEIDKLNLEIENLTLLFKDFEKCRDSSGVNSIPKSLQIASFLTTIEIVIQLFNKLLQGEKVEDLKDDYPILLFFLIKRKKPILV